MDKEYIEHLEELLLSYTTYILALRKILEEKGELNNVRSKGI